MDICWSVTQKQKLIELNAEPALLDEVFADTNARNQLFQKLEKELVNKNKEHLLDLKNSGFRPILSQLESKLIDRLNQEGFVQVITPNYIG